MSEAQPTEGEPREPVLRRLHLVGATWDAWRSSRTAEKIRTWTLVRAIRESLSVRSALAITLLALALTSIFGILVSAQLRTSAFESRKDLVLDDAAVRFSAAQSTFDQSTASTPDQVQETARQVVESLRSSAAGAGAVSVALLRDATLASNFRINQIVDVDVLGLIGQDMRSAVHESESAQWQSISIPVDDATRVPGILVGMEVEIPRAGPHELYIIYSLASDQRQVDMTMRVLLFAGLPLVFGLPLAVFWMLYRMLRPVRRAAEAAKNLASGNLDERVDVQGADEMAELSEAFNLMAESLQNKIEEYDELSQLQQRFVSDVSHELRTPLTTIRMADSIIWDNRDCLPGAAKRSAELLHEQTDRMDSLFTDLLEISRYDAQSADLAAELTDLRTVVAKAVAAHDELAQRLGVDVEVTQPDERCAAQIDVRRIERAVRNLLINALEFADGTRVHITIACNDQAVAVRVRDFGVGMSEETAARVFDRFYRADTSRTRTTGGTGLGLSIAAEDVGLHGGTLQARGELGKGASFLMTLPKETGAAIDTAPLELWEDE